MRRDWNLQKLVDHDLWNNHLTNELRTVFVLWVKVQTCLFTNYSFLKHTAFEIDDKWSSHAFFFFPRWKTSVLSSFKLFIDILLVSILLFCYSLFSHLPVNAKLVIKSHYVCWPKEIPLQSVETQTDFQSFTTGSVFTFISTLELLTLH